MNNEIDVKEVTFNNIIQWLYDIGFIIEKKEINKNLESVYIKEITFIYELLSEQLS